MNLVFKPEDFEGDVNTENPGLNGDEMVWHGDESDCVERPVLAAQLAQKVFDKWLSGQPKVFRLKNGLIVSPDPFPGTVVEYSGPVAKTHEGRLVDIKETP